MGTQSDTEQEPEQDEETIPTETMSATAVPMPKKGVRKKKKKSRTFSNIPKTSEAILKTDDPLLPAAVLETNYESA